MPLRGQQENRENSTNEELELEDWNSWDPMKEHFLSSNNTLALDPIADPESIITGKMTPAGNKIGNVTICDHYAKYGNCADGQYCDRIHISPKAREKLLEMQKTYELNKNRICMTSNYLSPIELEVNPEKRLLVSVVGVKSPNNFYIIAPYEQMNFASQALEDVLFYVDCIDRNSPYRRKMNKSHEQLADLFDHHYRLDNLNDDIFLSQIVACKLPDQRFYRAMVIETDDLHRDIFTYKLHLLDLGCEAHLPRELIFDIKAHCLSEPPMAVACRLDLRPADGSLNWPQEALNFLNNCIRSNNYMLCKIVNYIDLDRTFTVDLYTINERKSLTDELVASGLFEKSS